MNFNQNPPKYKTCEIEGCNRPGNRLGKYCMMHYQRILKGVDLYAPVSHRKCFYGDDNEIFTSLVILKFNGNKSKKIHICFEHYSKNFHEYIDNNGHLKKKINIDGKIYNVKNFHKIGSYKKVEDNEII